MTCTANNILYRNRDNSFEATATEGCDATAVDLTGATLKAFLTLSGVDTVIKDTDNGIEITDAEAGEFLVTFEPADLNDFPTGSTPRVEVSVLFPDETTWVLGSFTAYVKEAQEWESE